MELLIQGGFFDERLARIFKACGIVDHETCRLRFRARLRELELDALKFRQRLSELVPLLHVRRRRGERTLAHADHLRADADAPFVERFDRNLVALSNGAQDVLRRDFDTVEDELRGARRADAELVLLLANGESREAAFDDESGNALVARLRIDVGEHDVDARFGAIRNPHLAAREHPRVTALLGARCHAERVGARARLAERVGADGVARETRQVFRLERIAAVPRDGIVHERVLYVDQDGGGRVDLADLFDGERDHEQRSGRAAVLLGDLDAHQPHLEVFRDERGIDRPGSLHCGDARLHLVRREGGHRVAEGLLVVGEHGERRIRDGGFGGHGCDYTVAEEVVAAGVTAPATG